MISFQPHEYHAILRNYFSSFLQKSAFEVSPGMEYRHNWHIDLIAQKLEACRKGEIKRLIINIPPRSLKSISASVAFPAWLLGHDPTTQIICISYSQDLTEKHARDCRAVMGSSWYQEVFPTRLSKNKKSITEFTTTKQGTRLATSIGGTLTGRGANFIIIDDPLKPDEAVSETSRKNVNNWHDNTLYSRLNSKQDGCIIIIMQRLHLDDLVGHVCEQEDWDIVSLPAIAEREESYIIPSLFGTQVITRHPGEALHPNHEPIEQLDKLRRTLGEYNFSGQYQQAPIPLGGGMVKRNWIQQCEGVPTAFEHIVQSWDTANKATELNDYSVCTTWGIKDKKYYLIDVFRKRLNYPDLKRTVIALREQYKARIVLIEDKASGTQLIQDLRHDGFGYVKACKPEGDKVVRMHAQTNKFENGMVFLPKSSPWLDTYISELTTFPQAKYDDQVDSTSQALGWMTRYLRPFHFRISTL
ncbi:MAG: phage terminase large subunit [Proteobacteria bacterium]|nr:phage terminase large subunit [Pseudomonadota bacterium]